jgi:hypothetical protein
MLQIVVDAQEAALIKTAETSVHVVDQEGKLVGFVKPAPTDEELEKWRQRLAVDEPTYTSDEVLDYLRSLERQ